MEGQSQKTFFGVFFFFDQVTGSRRIETTDKMTSEDSEINEDLFWYFVHLWGGATENTPLTIRETVSDV